MTNRDILVANNMSNNRLAELEERTALLIKEVDGLRQENAEVDRLRQENGKLQERNLQLAAELAVKTRELEIKSLKFTEIPTPHQVERSRDSDISDNQFGVPGDSFPAVAASLDDIDSENNTDVEEDEEEPVVKNYETDYVLQKLEKGGNRMDQIKRQLVVQRGAIVAALKMLAQTRSHASTASIETCKSVDNISGEEDRALASITTNHTVAVDITTNVKLCPMCEVMFPQDCLEEFEQHVMDHFSYDSDPDTLQYFVQEGQEEGAL